MKKSEMVKILKFLNNYYQNKFKFPKESDMDTKQIIETWYIFLGEYDYEVVSASLKKLVINQAKWPPTPGEVIQEIDSNLNENNPNQVSGPQAWSMLLSAIRKHSWFYNPDKVKEELPETVLKAAQVTGLDLVANSNEGDTFIMNRFIKTFEQIKQHEVEREMLPGGIRRDLEKIERPGVKQLAGEVSGNSE
jgi:hypothetical protein